MGVFASNKFELPRSYPCESLRSPETTVLAPLAWARSPHKLDLACLVSPGRPAWASGARKDLAPPLRGKHALKHLVGLVRLSAVLSNWRNDEIAFPSGLW